MAVDSGYSQSSSIKKFGDSQPPHTKSVQKNQSGDNKYETIMQNLEKNKDSQVKLILAEAKNQGLSGGENRANKIPELISNLMSNTALVETAKLTGEAAKMQENAARIQEAASLPGKKVGVDNSIKSFNGESVKYEFDLIAKSMPKNAAINGQIIIRDKNKKEIYSEFSNFKLGKNSFTWSGALNSGNGMAQEGEYKIEVKASYNIAGRDDAKVPVAVVTVLEDEVERVNMDNDTIILKSGREISDRKSLVSVIASDNQSKSMKDEQMSHGFSNYESFIGKTVTIKENKFSFDGSSTNLGFISNEDVKEAKVKLLVTDKRGKLVAMDVQKMPLVEGRNTIQWVGSSTKNEEDIKNLQSGSTFPQVEKGEYNYSVRIYNEGNQEWDKASDKSEIIVDQVNPNKSEIVSESGATFPIQSVTSISATPQLEKGPSLQELHRDASGYVNRYVKTNNVFAFKDEDYTWEVPVSMPTETLYNGPMTLTIRKTDDFSVRDNIVKTISVDQEAVNNIVKNVALDFENMIQESKDALDTWALANLGSPDYSNLDQTKLDQLKTHVTEGVFKGTYKYDTKIIPHIGVSWDGKDEAGNSMPSGNYYLNTEAQCMDATTHNVVTSGNIDPPYHIVQAEVVNAKDIELTLSNGQRIRPEDVKVWV